MEQFNTIVLFGQLADLMEAETICLEKGYRYQIEPVPTWLTAGCGMCLALQNVECPGLEVELRKHAMQYRVESRR
jgi:Protein of unknown function (DUF3343).